MQIYILYTLQAKLDSAKLFLPTGQICKSVYDRCTLDCRTLSAEPSADNNALTYSVIMSYVAFV
jgi:hypothetical protein